MWGWLPILAACGLSTLEAPTAGGEGSPASNICQGMAGAGKYRPGVVLLEHDGGVSPACGLVSACASEGGQSSKTQCSPVLPRDLTALLVPSGSVTPTHTVLGPPHPPDTSQVPCPAPPSRDLSRDWDAQSGFDLSVGGAPPLRSRRAAVGQGQAGVPRDTVGCVALTRQWEKVVVVGRSYWCCDLSLAPKAPLAVAPRSPMLPPNPLPPQQRRPLPSPRRRAVSSGGC